MTDAKIVFEDYTPERKANPYDETVAQLAEAGEGKSVVITVDAGKHSEKSGQYLNAAMHKRLFGEAARNAGYSARTKEEKLDEKAKTVSFRFILGAAQTRKPAGADTPVNADDH